MVQTDSFRKHHSEVRRLIATISDLLDAELIARDSAPISIVIRELFGKFSIHLAMEDGLLYPRMIASEDAAGSETAHRFQEEMGGLKSQFDGYKERWPNRSAISSDPAAFVAETRGVIRALTTRIRREEEELYPLGDRVISVPAPAGKSRPSALVGLPSETAIADALPAAIANGEIVPFFQPKYDLFRQRIMGFEALARWSHPEWGMVPPGLFVPVAERTGMMDAIGETILRQACQEAAAWLRAGVAVPVAVNVSPLQLRRGGAYEAEVLSALSAADLPPRLLELEITEGVLMDRLARSVLDRLIDCRIGIAIDDFGTGYSSLAYLRQFPAKTLKIDKSFIDDMPGSLDNCILISAIIRIGHSFGMRIVAEGVESSEQMQALGLTECDMVQGFVISAAVPAAEALAMLLGEGEAQQASVPGRVRDKASVVGG